MEERVRSASDPPGAPAVSAPSVALAPLEERARAEDMERGRDGGVVRGGARWRPKPVRSPPSPVETGGESAGRLEREADVRGRAVEAGHARVSREAEIEAVLAAPIEGAVAAGYQRKEEALRAELGRLTVAESRALAARLRRARPDDPIAALFGRMTAERRGRLLGFLDDARRREAVGREREGRRGHRRVS